MTSRKPTLLRWAEEAEAKQVCEWAGFEHASDRVKVGAPPSPSSSDRPSLLRRLRGLFGSQTVQIGQDE